MRKGAQERGNNNMNVLSGWLHCAHICSAVLGMSKEGCILCSLALYPPGWLLVSFEHFRGVGADRKALKGVGYLKLCSMACQAPLLDTKEQENKSWLCGGREIRLQEAW